MTQTPPENAAALRAAEVLIAIAGAIFRVVQLLVKFVLALLWIMTLRLMAVIGDDRVRHWLRELWDSLSHVMRLLVEWVASQRSRSKLYSVPPTHLAYSIQ